MSDQDSLHEEFDVADPQLTGLDGLIGLRVTEATTKRVVGSLAADARHHQAAGLVHGGVYCTMVETLASIGAWLHVCENGQTVVGVHNATDFLRPHRHGRLTGVAEPVHTGRTQQLWEVTITRDDGKPVARGQVRLHAIALDDDPTS